MSLLQSPAGVPLDPGFATVTDPLLPPSTVESMLAHFPDEVYDKRAETRLVRLLKVLLGDAGAGALRKRYTYAHLSTYLSTIQYFDLDRFFSGVFGLRRFLRESVDIDGYNDAATLEEWEAIETADAAYRARIQAFMASLQHTGTPGGMAMAASAVLGEECRVYETYEFIESGGLYPFDSRLPGPGGRREFVVRPMREITAEERHHIVRVLERLKPVGTLLTIDASFAQTYQHLPVARASATSVNWVVESRVAVPEQHHTTYAAYDPAIPVQQPRLSTARYQGEAWSHNGDVDRVVAYAEDGDGVRILDDNYSQVLLADGSVATLPPDAALASISALLRGRVVSDGVLATATTSREGVR